MKYFLLLFLGLTHFFVCAQKSVHWISNAGFYIDTPDGDILIDAILNSDDEIARAEGKFADVKLIFVSHVHGDHFNAAGIIRHLKANGKAQVILTPESHEALIQNGLDETLKSRITVSHPEGLEAFNLNGLSGHILRFNHSGVENIGVGLSGNGLTLLYLNGGTENKDSMRQLTKLYPKNDLLIANKWPLNNPAYIDQVQDLFSPTLLLMAHHSGAQEDIVQNNGGLTGMEKKMSRPGMKGRVFIKRMEREIF